ncbi:hypothetical protein FGADI_12323 [Fusarium gaditjirri]|uniref:Piwi domain-containing protein n=1 Tax=Fusarium gaditjirri TaxID=282569 RepID=A0A8H4WP57_9HYPO|nr:hypothetical protein FGADI_12323 [Fusarium gaditjirri]
MEEEAEEEVAGAIMDLGGAAVVSEAIQAEVEDGLEVEEEGMEGRLAVVNKLSRSFRKDHMEQSQNSQVAKVEDALHLATKTKLDLDGLKLTGFPSRRGYGTRGIKVQLTANYVELLLPSNLTLHRYHIQISPVAVGKKHFRVVQLLLQAPEFATQQGDIATDFRFTLVSKTKFSQDEVLVEVPYRSEGEDEPTARATVYKVRVQYTKTLNIGELVNYLNSTSLSQSLVDKQELTQALNIFLNHYAKSAKNLVTIGSTKSFSLSSNAARGDIGSGLEIIRGFFSSVRIATCRILVNINLSHGAFYHAVPLQGLMKTYGLHSAIMLERFLKLVRIQTTHLPKKRNKANEVIPRVKTIFGLARKDDGHGLAHPPRVRQHGAGAKDVEFWLDGEASPSGAPKPVAKRGAKGKGKGKGKAQAESSAASTPGSEGVQTVGLDENNKAADLCFGSWNMSDIRFNIGASLAKWSYLMISIPGIRDSFDQQSSRAVMNEFHAALQKIGVDAAQPFPGQRLQLQHPDDPALDSTLQRAAGALHLLFITLPGANIPLYKRIKTIADKNYGIHTICSVGSKLAKDRGREQYMANVALKFNLKLGGIDVTHPSPGSSSNAPSVSAMVASIDKFLGQWPATLRIQRARQENVDDLTEMLKSRPGLWKTKGKHTALAENILIYRDGVSEGQYDMILSQELPQLRRACEQMYPAVDTKKGLPRFTIIVCGKRHKTRFYPTTEQDCDRSGNTKPGTVVDRGVTEARNWDFFLQ